MRIPGANMFSSFVCPQEACQTARPVQGHGERSPEGGAVWKENAEEEGESLKNVIIFQNGLETCVLVC